MVRVLYVASHIPLLFAIGSSLKCYGCDNIANPACGEYFKAYQFRALDCPGPFAMCGLQRQPPFHDGWVGIIRKCYRRGDLYRINETYGCHNWTNPNSYAITVCFCGTDYCNQATSYTNIGGLLVLFCVLLQISLFS